MAYQAIVNPGVPRRWVIEPGDLVYYRPSADSRRYQPARIPWMNRQWVYLAAGEWVPGDPLGIGPETEVWRVRTSEAHLLIVPRCAVAKMRGKLFFDWSNPPIVKAA